jgi:hypothetical protein
VNQTGASSGSAGGHGSALTVFRPRLAVIVDAGGGDVGVAQPLLDLGDVGLIVERVGGGGRPQQVGVDLNAQLRGIPPDQSVNRVGRERFVEPAGAVVLDWAKERTVLVAPCPAASR